MTDIPESDVIKHLLNGLREAENSARILGYNRRNEQWIKVAALINQMRIKSEAMLIKRSALILQ